MFPRPHDPCCGVAALGEQAAPLLGSRALRARHRRATSSARRRRDELGLWPGGSTQLFQYFNAKLVGPVVEHSGEEKDGDVRLLCGLWLEEVVALGRGKGGGPNVSEHNPGLWKEGSLKTLLLQYQP